MVFFEEFKSSSAFSVTSTILFFHSFVATGVSLFLFMLNKSVLLEWEIFSVSSTSASLCLVLDWVSVSFSALVSVISASVFKFSVYYMSEEKFLSRFVSLVVLFVISMNFLIFIPNLISLLIGWDGLGLVSFILVIYYRNAKSLSAGMLTALANRVGDVMLLASIALCVSEGHWGILFLWENEMSRLLAMSVVLGSMTKSAQIPFSSWLPAAMAAPTPVSALVHSSTLVTAGVYLLIRFFPMVDLFEGLKGFLLVVSVLTLGMASMGANFEYDLKKIIALSTLSQLGLMVMSISMGLPFLALFHLYTHALFKAMMFICAGSIISKSSHYQDIRKMGGLWSQMPLTVACLNISSLALCGAPFMSGFYSKDLILESLLFSSYNFFMVVLALLATGMTMSYSVRMLTCSVWGVPKHSALHQKYEEDFVSLGGMGVLWLGVIVMGAALQGVVLEFSGGGLALPICCKMVVPFVLSSGFILTWWMTSMSDFSVRESSWLMFFNCSLWFLSVSFSRPATFSVLSSGSKMEKSLDQGWGELFGGRGVFMLGKFLSGAVQTGELAVMFSSLSLVLVLGVGAWALFI